MRLRRPSLAESVVAAACGLWVVLFLVSTTPWAIPAGLTVTALTALLPQRPLLAGAALAGLQWSLALAHITDDSAALLMPFIIAVYSLGRHARLWPGVAVAASYPLSTLVEFEDADLSMRFSTLAFAVLLTTAVLSYGRVVRRRAIEAKRSRATASRLQGTDAVAAAARIVADERARLGGQALALLRDAVEGMRADATAAHRELDPDLLDAIAARGRQAVTELRWLLGLLRSAPPPAPAPPETSRRNVRQVVDAGIAAALLTSSVLEVASSDIARSSLPAWVVAVGLPVCVLLRSRFTVAALGGAVVVAGVAAIGGVPTIVSGLACIILLAWSAGVAGGPLPWTCLGVLAAGTLAWTALNEPRNVAIGEALIALSAFAGHEWSAHDRAERAAATQAESLQAALDARIDEARREERLRIARELHDVASHAVGVMVLQASAVQALRDGDPAAARRALATIDSTAAQALTELAMLFDLLDSGAIGEPGLAGVARDPLAAMVERLRSTGLQITLEVDPIPAELDETVYRIVQESLTNVIRHSDALHVHITVIIDGGLLSVRVVDDGRFFVGRADSTALGGGFGLAGMAERVRSIGGAFRAGAGDDHGFTVDATMPVSPAVRS